MKTYFPDDVAFSTMGNHIFGFINRYAHEQYTDRTMMAIVRQCDAKTARMLVIDSEEVQIDPLTEVKTGGIRAAAVVLRDGRVVLAVKPELRRQGIGRKLLMHIFRMCSSALDDDIQYQFWCNTTNVAANALLTSTDCEVAAIRTNGMVCYTPIYSPVWD